MLTHIQRRDGSYIIVRYTGELVEPIALPLPGCETADSRSCSGVILDLSGVDYINSIGVSAFMENAKYLKSRGINVVLCSVLPHVFKVLKLARSELLMPIANDLNQAKEFLSKIKNSDDNSLKEQILVVQGANKIGEDLKSTLKMTLQDVQFNIITTLNTERAWKVVSTSRIQLVVFDITIPMIEGHNFLQRIRSNRELASLPFLIVSEETNLPNAAYYAKNGADDIIRYPFNPYELPSRIRTALTLYYNWQDSLATIKNTSYPSDTLPFIRG